mmetsp:Transcript_21580/g.49151  ORF Transcript_21580/g.49151 Transcript_21580/m.49151 type:complete len:235 (+) Transcript_21580:464-1168(+)
MLPAPRSLFTAKKDSLVPVTHGRQLHEMCRARKMFVAPEAMEHNTSLMSEPNYFVMPMLQFFALPDYIFEDICVPDWAYRKKRQEWNPPLSRPSMPSVRGVMKPLPFHDGDSGTADDLHPSERVNCVVAALARLPSDARQRDEIFAELDASVSFIFDHMLDSLPLEDVLTRPRVKGSVGAGPEPPTQTGECSEVGGLAQSSGIIVDLRDVFRQQEGQGDVVNEESLPEDWVVRV